MKRIAIILLFITQYSFAQVDSEFISEKLIERLSESKYYALVIGNNNYPNPGIPNLENPISDAESLINTLTTKYSFDIKDIVFLQNATRIEIIEHFDLFARKITPQDNFLVFYAGHGKWDPDIEQGYWLPVDAKAESSANWISNSDIRDKIKKVKSKHSLLISDACFSGGIFRGREVSNVRAMLELYNAPSRRAITSGALNTVPDKSVFMRYLIKKLNENDNTLISAEQLFNSFKMIVIDNSPRGQKPQFGVIGESGDEGGDFIFLRKEVKSEINEINKEGISTNIDNTTDEDPILIAGKVMVDYGTIMIDTQIGGELYLDGKKLGYLQANSTGNQLNKIKTGAHTVKIVGRETQTHEITVYKDRATTFIFLRKDFPSIDFAYTDFTDIQIDGSFETNIVKSDDYKVNITGSQLDLENISVDKQFKRLIIEQKNKILGTKILNRHIKINIALPELNYVNFIGGSKSIVTGFDGDYLRIQLNGSCEAEIEVNMEEVDISLNGASSLKLTGRGNELRADINAASQLKAYSYRVMNATVDATAASTAEVYVTETLDMHTKLASKIKYRGGAKRKTSEKTDKDDFSVAAGSSFTDSRDRKTYKSVRIGNQVWMAENLDYRMPGSTVNEKGDRLYSWKVAMKACPAGWHLPSDKEWDILINQFGGATKAGAALKSKTGWKGEGNGTNSSGFTGLPAGYRENTTGIFHYTKDDGYFWSSTEENEWLAWIRNLYYFRSEVGRHSNFKLNSLSCRCVRDVPIPTLAFTEEEYDFGTIKEGEIVEHTFSFTNTGEAPLIIESVKASCGCISLTWPKEPIAVGESGEIIVRFNTTGKPNIQNKTATITANTYPKISRLRLRSFVTPK